MHSDHIQKWLRALLAAVLIAALTVPGSAAFAKTSALKQADKSAASSAAKVTASASGQAAKKAAISAEKTAKKENETNGATAKKTKKTARATIMLTGDLMCHPGQQQAAYDGESFDFTPTFRYVKQIFDQADLVVGNLETLISKSNPLSKDINYLQTRPYLNAPESFLDALEYAGYDVLVTANNHACDGGETGLLETLDALDAHGFAHTGTFRGKKEKRYVLAEAGDIKVGILSYATYFNKKETFLSDKKQEYMLNRPSEKRLKADVKALRQAGAEYIIAYNHCGKEYSHEPAARQKRYARMFAEAGVDHIISSHPHVLQPYGTIKSDGKAYPVMYSMGNFVSGMSDHATKETIILSLTLQRDQDGKVSLFKQKYYPCYLLDFDYQSENAFVLLPQDSRYNGNFQKNASAALVKEIRTHFQHIRKIVGKLD